MTGGAAPGGSNAPKEGTRLSAAEIHDNIVAPGEKELHRGTRSLFFSSLGSGLAIGYSFLAGGYAMSLAPDRFDTAVAAAVYPLGFMLVIIARMELFTETTVVPVLPLLRHPTLARFRRLLRVWLILLVACSVPSCSPSCSRARRWRPSTFTRISRSSPPTPRKADSGGWRTRRSSRGGSSRC